MNKINFENLPSTNTPINASNLNQLQTNIENEFANRYDLTRGTVIPNNSDLNNFTTLGSFYCESSSKAQSLSNCPVASAFKMVVESVGASNWVRQTIKGQGQNSQTWIRTYNGSNWGNWEQVVYQSVIQPIQDIMYSKFYQSYGTSLKITNLASGKLLFGIIGSYAHLTGGIGGNRPNLTFDPMITYKEETSVRLTIDTSKLNSDGEVTIKRTDNQNFTGQVLVFG